MKNTSSVRSTSRVRSDTPIMACSAIENGACGSADAAISANGAQCCGYHVLKDGKQPHQVLNQGVTQRNEKARAAPGTLIG